MSRPSSRFTSRASSRVGPMFDLEANRSEDELADYIRANIPIRRCKQYILNQKKPGTCQCGHPFEEHDDEAKRQQSGASEWSEVDHTKAVNQADWFGEIEFSTNSQKPAKYIRVDSRLEQNSQIHHITEVLLKHWGLRVPNLIITVTGGALSFNLSRQLSQKFRHGIVRAAQSTGAWIVTGGTYTGVMKHTGKAVRDCTIQQPGLSDVVCLGIAPWGVIQGQSQLKSSSGQRRVVYDVPSIDKKAEFKPIYLDPNHTHFILVDNGTRGAFQTEIKLRAELEKFISKMSPDSDRSVNVPVCCVVVQGGPGSLKTVLNAVMAGTPVVIVKDSGMIADVLADAYAWTKGEEVTAPDELGEMRKQTYTMPMTPAVKDKVRDLIKLKMDPKSTDSVEKVERMLKEVEDCLHRRDLVTIYRLDASDVTTDLDVAILLALFRARHVTRESAKDEHQHKELKTSLKLCLAWNRIDAAQKYLFTGDRSWPRGFFNDIAYTAFVNDRVEFIKVFIKNRFQIKDFLSIAYLARLYDEVGNWKDSDLYRMLSEPDQSGLRRDIGYRHGHPVCLFHIGRLLDNVFGDMLGHPYCTDDRYNWVDTCVLKNMLSNERNQPVAAENRNSDLLSTNPRLTVPPENNRHRRKMYRRNEHVLEYRRKMTDDQERQAYLQVVDVDNRRRVDAKRKEELQLLELPHFDDPAFDLFIFFVLLNRAKMADLCFEHVREVIPAALTATKIYQVMAERADNNEAQAKYTTLASKYELVAFNILSECFEASPSAAQVLLTRAVSQLNGRTCLNIAQSAHAIQFISHPCCQTLFNRLWYGKILGGPRPINITLIASSCFVPPLLFALNYEGIYKSPLKQSADERPTDTTTQAPNQNRTTNNQTDDTSVKYPNLLKIAYFYNAPFVIFIHSIMSYAIFLILMSYDLLIVYPTLGVDWANNWAEIILVTYVISLFLEQLRSAVDSGTGPPVYLIYQHVTSSWNLLEMVAIVLFMLAMILGNIQDTTIQATSTGRIFYAISYVLFFSQILRWYAIDKTLGPKVVMVGRMLKDLVTFMGILLIYVFAWGVAQYALLFPQAPAQWTLIRDVLVLPYWQMFTGFYFNVMQQLPFDASDQCTNDPDLYSNYTMARCADPTGQWVVPILLAVYVMLTVLLLFNLLIALFAYTFASVQDENDQHWNYQRFELISEYISKPPLVPPFIVLSHLFIVCKAIHYRRLKLRYRKYQVNNYSKVHLDELDDTKKRAWMCSNRDEYIHKKEKEGEEAIEERVRNMHAKMLEVHRTMAKLAVVPLDSKARKIWPKTVELQCKVHQQNLKEAVDTKLILEAVRSEKLEEAVAQNKLYQELLRMAENADLTTKMLQGILKMVDNIAVQIPFAEGSLVGRTALQRQRSRTASFRLSSALHRNALLPDYPLLGKRRSVVPRNKVVWDAQFKRYQPTLCSAPDTFLENNYFSWDSDLLVMPLNQRKLAFNQYDVHSRCNRMASAFFTVKDGVPYNPVGRTGLIGRGILPRWGPNHAALCAIVRRKLQQVNNVWKQVEIRDRPVLEVLMLVDESGRPSLPQSLFESVKTEVLTSMLTSLQNSIDANASLDADQSERLHNRLQQCFTRRGKTVYKGYLDSEFNTDNAWIEAQCVGLFVPDDLGQAVSNVGAQFKWTEVSSRDDLIDEDENLCGILRRLAEHFGGYFY